MVSVICADLCFVLVNNEIIPSFQLPSLSLQTNHHLELLEEKFPRPKQFFLANECYCVGMDLYGSKIPYILRANQP